MKKNQKKLAQPRTLSVTELEAARGSSGSNTVFVRRNGETGILRPAVAELAGGMSGGTGIGG